MISELQGALLVREGQRLQPSLPPTFVRVIQLEDVWVLRVIRQLHHPAYDGDLLARCRFVLEESDNQLGGLDPHTPCPWHGRLTRPILPLAATGVPPTRGSSRGNLFRGLTCFLSVPRKDLAP